MVKLTKRDLAIIGGLAGVADFLAEGRLSAPLSRALKRAAVAAGKRAIFTAPAAARVARASALRGAGTVARVAGTVALRHPILTAGAVVYYTYKNRDELGDLVSQGYEVIQDINAPMAERRREFASDPIGFTQDIFEDRPLIRPLGAPIPGLKPKRRKSNFNKAVSAGMKVVKGSTSYGKKGTISNAKKAFAAVTKTASKINKGAKVAKSGITRKIGLAVKGILK